MTFFISRNLNSIRVFSPKRDSEKKTIQNPKLLHKLATSFEEIAACNIAVNSLYTTQTLKRHTKFLIRPYGKVFLKEYGYRAIEESYAYIADMEERCRLAGERLLLQSGTCLPRLFEELLKKEFLAVYLCSSGMPNHLCKYYQLFFKKVNLLWEMIQNRYKEEKAETKFTEFSEEAREKFPKFTKILDRRKRYEIEKEYQKISMRLLGKLLTQGSSLERWSFDRFSQSLDGYAKEVLDDLPVFEELSQEVEQNFDKTLLRRINFYEFLACTVSVEGTFEYCQGEEGQGSILGQGVCFGLCFEMAKLFWTHPGSELTKENTQTISASARIYQAHSDLVDSLPSCFKKRYRDLPLSERRSLIPEKLQRLAGVHSSALAFFSVDDRLLIELTSYFCSEMMGKEEPSCLLSISISEKFTHSVYMRFDGARERYIFFDPNFGTFERKGCRYLEGLGWLLATVISCVESYKGYQIALSHYALNR